MRIKKATNGQPIPKKPAPKKDGIMSEQKGRMVYGKEAQDIRERDRLMTEELMKRGPVWNTTQSKSAPKKKMKTGGKLTTAKGGKQMLKRADGSVSQRGLWDNIRAAAKKNKAAGKAGKKPTAAMLKQERKIKAKSKK